MNNPVNPVNYTDTTQCRGMRYALRIRALPGSGGGTITTDTAGLHVSKATEVVLLLSAATSFNGFDKCPDKAGKNETQLVENYLNGAARKTYETLKKAHVADYQSYFNRVSLSLADNKENNLPTDERLKQYATGSQDLGLERLYYQYGRYLLISSSRPAGNGSVPATPANLQGIWNPHVRPPWSSNFTININTEMNYWPAEVSNLSEMHRPLFDLIDDVAVTGKTTAKTSMEPVAGSRTTIPTSGPPRTRLATSVKVILSGPTGRWVERGCVSIFTTTTATRVTNNFCATGLTRL